MATTYSESSIANVGHLKQLVQDVKTRLDTTLKSMSVSGNTVSFFTSTDGSGTAAYTFDFPTEYFLDQAKTTFASSFSWSATTYPNSTNPNLNGKPVLVLAVKGTDGSTTYSFINVASLIDTYTSGNTSTLTISGRTITVKVSAVTNNAITIKSDGLHVDLSGKADKVSSATANDLAALDANGNLVDSGIAKSTVTGYASAINAKAAKVSSATANNLAMLTSAGDLADSGIAKSTVTGYATSIANNTTAIGTKATKLTGSNIVADNLLTMNSSGDLTNSGIAKSTVTGYATSIAAKATKLTGSNIVANNLLSMNSSGDLANSGIAISTVNGKATKVSSATANNLAALTSAGDLADSGIAKTTIAAKIDKLTSATANRIAVFVSGGGLADGGILKSALLTTANVATADEVTAMLTEVFG